MLPTLIASAALAITAAITPLAQSRQTPDAGWPGLWGPARTATVASGVEPVRIARELWRRPASGGYSEVVVSGTRAVTMDVRDGVDVVVSVDAATGRPHWTATVGPTYRGHDSSKDGPIATPAIAGDQVFAVGPHAVLVALDLRTGREHWRRDLRELGTAMPIWGFAASPLIEGDLVIVPTGGPSSPGLVAFARDTGRVAWSTGGGTAVGYSSAIAATIDGVRQVIAFRGDRLFAVAPANGQVLWSLPGPDPTLEILNSPILVGERSVLVSHARETMLVSVAQRDGRFRATETWKTIHVRSQVGPLVHHQGHLYGFVGPQLVCVDASTGEIRWRERIGRGTLAAAGAQLFVLDERTGDLRVVEAARGGYRLASQTRVFTPDVTSVTGPSIAYGRLYVRNTNEIAAFELGP
jgi:outer membrane protein assembly factor BamB